MATESTLLIVKPDGVRRRLVGEILRRVEAKGLTIDAMDLRVIDRATAEEHYGEHRERPFFGELTQFMSRSPIVVLALEAEDIARALKERTRRTDRLQALAGELGDNVAWRQLDVTDVVNFDAFADAAAEHFGRIDALVAQMGRDVEDTRSAVGA